MNRTALWAGLICAVILGCGGSVETAGGQGGSGGAGGGSGGAGGGSGGAGGGSGGAGGNSGACTADNPCKEGTCIFAKGTCAPGATGTCQNGFTCDGPPSGPACGCDGEVVEQEYGECAFWSAGQPYSDAALCAKGTFACGDLQCARHIEVCKKTLPGPVGEPSYECVTLASMQGFCSNGIADCACLDLQAFGCPTEDCCEADADHQETITIALP